MSHLKYTWPYILAAALLLMLVYEPANKPLPPGAVAPDDPLQTELQPQEVAYGEGYRVVALAGFDITARVLSVENYYMGSEAEFSPVDFALGWGPMSDSAVLEKLDISQSGRWYRWRPKDTLPLPKQEISNHSANMHMIPANDAVKSILKTVSRNDVVSIEGKLVQVEKTGGWRWRSSLTRNDTGNGACELVWVESIHVEN